MDGVAAKPISPAALIGEIVRLAGGEVESETLMRWWPREPPADWGLRDDLPSLLVETTLSFPKNTGETNA
jgi:hypothetical protein